jgi:hypothetical protein
MYVFANDLADRGVKKMEKKNLVFTKDGMKVGVKEVRSEDYADKTQRLACLALSLRVILASAFTDNTDMESLS